MYLTIRAIQVVVGVLLVVPHVLVTTLSGALRLAVCLNGAIYYMEYGAGAACALLADRDARRRRAASVQPVTGGDLRASGGPPARMVIATCPAASQNPHRWRRTASTCPCPL